MPSRSWKLMSLAVLFAGVACGQTATDAGNGRLELVIRPDTMAACHRPLLGSFLLHGLDQPIRVRIDVAAQGYLTRSVSLVPGSYTLQWQPELDLDVFGVGHPAAGGLQRALTTEPRVLLLVAAGRVTTLNVRSTLDPSRAARVVAASAAPPEAERLARY